MKTADIERIGDEQISYLHCHTQGCDWGQDDFWSEDGYTPLNETLISDYREALFKDRIYFDEWFFKENPSLEGKQDAKGWYCYGPDYAVWGLKRKARNIERMFVRTEDEWKQIRATAVCPDCGESNWDID